VPGIGIINNPHSRKNKRNPQQMDCLGYMVGSKGEAVATRDISDIHEMARLYKEREIDILGINGGDGSNHVTLTAFIEEYGDQPLPKIALLRGGTMNTISNSCGIKGTQAGLMMNLIRKYREKIPFETIRRDTVKVDGRYGFIFGNGLIHNFLDAYYGTGNPKPWTAFKLLVKGTASSIVNGNMAKKMFKRFQARVYVDGKEWSQDSYTAMAGATIHQIGLGFTPFFRCEERPHSFHFLGIVTPPLGFALAMPKIWFGRKVSPKKIIEQVAEEVVFESDEPLKYTLDGDTHQTGKRMTLTVGPRLEIVVR
jgi:diacylglycerol kinase family enzyme